MDDKSDLVVVIGGEARPMCCPGCHAIASIIVNGGLETFYKYRSGQSEAQANSKIGFEDSEAEDFTSYDLPGIQSDLLRFDEQGRAIVELGISGITCTACAWLIEHHLNKLPDVENISVNVNRQQCRIVWDNNRQKLSHLMQALQEIGYRPYPLSDQNRLEQFGREQRQFILRLGLAGIGMMQAGMLAIALYAGAFQGMEERWEELLRWVSLVVATPVVLYSARPFFTGARRSLKTLHPTMDVPIALAIALAYLASTWATLTRQGEVYFDAVSMLTFFLLLGRFFEMRVRYRNELTAGEATQLIPLTTMRSTAGKIVGKEYAEFERVPVKSLCPGDVIQVAEGEGLPVDGLVLEGESRVQEAVLTGEQAPVVKRSGDMVSAGTVNTVNRLTIQVSAVGHTTRLSTILDMLNGTIAEKPLQAQLADRIAAWFVSLILILALAVYGSWYLIDTDRALWVTLSVLVVTCPCALSLATPVALAAATGLLQRRGFLLRSGHVLQTLPRVTRVILDKTGTLTSGKLKLIQLLPFDATTGNFSVHASEQEKNKILDIVAALEQGCRHPIAMSLNQRKTPKMAEQLDYQVGCGVSASVDGEQFALGKPTYVAQVLGLDVLPMPEQSQCLPETGAGSAYRTEIVLANRRGLCVWLVLADEIRQGAKELISNLYDFGLRPELLSGDQQKSVGTLARELDLKVWSFEKTPEDKLAYIRKWQKQGDKVLVVGDGINDVPVLSGADVSVAMGEATDFTRQASDAILLSGNLNTLIEVFHIAKKTETIIRQNIAWALLYNISALPLAAFGWVPPWAAALGMSASSLVVVLNALRLQKSSAGKRDSTVCEFKPGMSVPGVGV